MMRGDRVIVPGDPRLPGEWRVLEAPDVDGFARIVRFDQDAGVSIMRTLPVEQLARAPEPPKRARAELPRPRVQEVAVLFRERGRGAR